MANIRLNVLPISENTFSFNIFRQLCTNDDLIDEGIFRYHLFPTSTSTEKENYLVSFAPKDGFSEFLVNSEENIFLTKKFLFKKLIEVLSKGCLLEYETITRFAEERIEFTLHTFKEGKQIIFLSPYYLEEQRRFGFIIDFRFAKEKGLSFNKDVQIKSLSLDNQGRSNKNYYSDKFTLINSFLDKVYNQLYKLENNNSLITIKRDLVEVPVFLLNKKDYIFENNRIGNSQFQGIRNGGPFQKIDKEIIFAFIFEDRFKSFANELYLSLTGKSNPGTFPGFEQMFSVKINIHNVKQIKIKGYSNECLLEIVEEVQKLQQSEPNKKVIGVYIEDYDIDADDSLTSKYYYFLKYNFIKKNIALQVVNYRKLSERNSLKWSTSNLALAMFSKMGGIPWLVKPSNNDCLILGIGSSHKRDLETGKIIKYFAYTVCLDSSGLYKTVEVLADEVSEEGYLEELSKNLVKILKEGKIGNYKTCVLHLPFKIKHKEISALSKALNEVNNIDFVAIKINLDNKYFGYSFHNTLVPYESSFVKLSKNEYLVWFEGLHYGKEVVDKRLSNPVHIQFLNMGNTNLFEERKYLQDVLNLSGANWRGFNAKSIPISIYYSQIIAKYSEAFEKIEGYEENSISNDKPWFL